MDKDEIVRELKKVLSDIDGCERNINGDNKSRALYELGYAEQRIRKLLRALA
ncbi:hypothetical protein [Rhizobium laguerreae]|uniref:hypothetical protein n=1 Tax=Rhizobium laguerreae TaxID=1076926 RepID=UPI00144118D5|nr:hypothetical protein [Rhizobium laguerreae]